MMAAWRSAHRSPEKAPTTTHQAGGPRRGHSPDLVLGHLRGAVSRTAHRGGSVAARRRGAIGSSGGRSVVEAWRRLAGIALIRMGERLQGDAASDGHDANVITSRFAPQQLALVRIATHPGRGGAP